MKKIIIKTGKPEITDEQILATKAPFEQVLKEFHAAAKPFYKTTWFSGGIAAIILATVAFTGYYFIKGGGNKNLIAKKTDSLIVKPIKGMDIPYESIIVSSNCSHQLVTKTGSILRIPENAFVDSLGKPVPLPVELKYREMRNPVDFFVAGIPMNYDSAGVDYTLESAGMFELLASKDGQNLSLAKDKTIGVDMKLPSDGNDYNTYYLDARTGNWIYKGKNEVTPLTKEQIIAEQNNLNITKDTTAMNSLVMPVMKDKSKYIFHSPVDFKEFPELNLYKNVLFQVAESDKNFDPKLYNVKWTNGKLFASETPGTYMLTLSKNDTSVSIAVNPVFDDKGYESAIAIYNKNIKQLKDEQQDRDNQLALQKQTMLSSQKNLQQTTDIATNILMSEIKALRTFDITTFGVWNCDKPVPPINRNFTLNPEFINNADGKELTYESAYIVDLNKNALFTYGPSKSILCNKKSDNIMWILTPDNQIGIINSDMFSNAINTTLSPKFKLNLLSSSEGVKELRSLVGKESEGAGNSNEVDIKTKPADYNMSVVAYPNPTKDVINIKLQQSDEINYFLTDMNGKVIQRGQFNGTEYKIDLSNYISGTYNLTLLNSNQKLSKTIKILKQ